MRCALGLVLAAACSGPAKPVLPPAPPTKPVTAIADLAGTWQATDIDGWTYRMQITGDRMTQTIDRTRGGACEQAGLLRGFQEAYGQPYDPAQFGGVAGSADGAFALTVQLVKNECNPDYNGAQLIVLASQFTGDAVTLRTMVGWGGPQETRSYQRAPAPP